MAPHFRKGAVIPLLTRRDCVFVGVDTHKAEHVAAVVDCWHEPLGLVRVRNDPQDFPRFLNDVQKCCPTGMQLIFGLEGTGALGRSLAIFLAEQGHVVKEINPVHTDRERGHAPHPDKSDPQDAQAIARVLVQKYQTLPNAPFNPHGNALGYLVHHRAQAVRSLTEVKNRLHALLFEQYPCYRSLFFYPFGKAAMSFWSRFPSPLHLRYFGPTRLAAFLRKHSNHALSTKRAIEILALAKPYIAPNSRTEIQDGIIRHLVQQANLLQNQVAETERQMALLLQADGAYLTTMPGVDVVAAARLLAYIGDTSRFTSADKLARYAGVAPQDDSTGRTRRRRRSTRGHRKLNATLYMIALAQISTSRHGEPWVPIAHTYYQRKITEGKSKKAALRCLMRRLCDVLYAMMKHHRPYQPQASVGHPVAA